MKPLTMDQLEAARGTFTGLLSSKEKTIPNDAEVFPIVGGPWPHPRPEAIEVPCALCHKSAGVSPIGYALWERNKGRFFLHAECSLVVANAARADAEASGTLPEQVDAPKVRVH